MNYPEVIEYSVGDDKFKAELDYVDGDEAMYLVYLHGGSELDCWLCYCHNSYKNIQEIINKEKQMTQNTKQSHKPFNLQAALEGAPVMTMQGDKVIRIVHFPEATRENARVIALLENGAVISCCENGKYYENNESTYDLVMAPTTKTGWVNVFIGEFNTYFASRVYTTYEEAVEVKKNYHNYITTTKIEWEE